MKQPDGYYSLAASMTLNELRARAPAVAGVEVDQSRRFTAQPFCTLRLVQELATLGWAPYSVLQSGTSQYAQHIVRLRHASTFGPHQKDLTIGNSNDGRLALSVVLGVYKASRVVSVPLMLVTSSRGTRDPKALAAQCHAASLADETAALWHAISNTLVSAQAAQDCALRVGRAWLSMMGAQRGRAWAEGAYLHRMNLDTKEVIPAPATIWGTYSKTWEAMLRIRGAAEIRTTSGDRHDKLKRPSSPSEIHRLSIAMSETLA